MTLLAGEALRDCLIFEITRRYIHDGCFSLATAGLECGSRRVIRRRGFSGLKKPAEEFDRAQSSSSSVHVYARQNKKKTNIYKTSHS